MEPHDKKITVPDRKKSSQGRYLIESPEDAAGRLMMIGWEGQDSGEIRELIDEFRPGGLVFFRRNYPNRLKFAKPGLGWRLDLRAPGFIGEILTMIQKYAQKILGRSIIIAVDQEGGLVRRLPEPFFQLPSAREMGMLEIVETRRLAERAGREMRASGFNLNLAPVLDLDSLPGGYIGSRSFGVEPERVISHAKAFMGGLLAGGMLACGKHFPGLGGAVLDPHERIPEISWDETKMATAMAVFQALVEVGLPAIMTTHARYPALDPDHIATFSGQIVGKLRREIGFNGLLLTDDLEMGAIVGEQEPGRAAVKAVLVGHDLVLVCRKIEVVRAVYRALLASIASNQITKGHLMESGLRYWRMLDQLNV
ncbi:MAG: hypothetical protein LBT86_00365 [Deltaproteobacteria bacterium]|jgi:beta-N-acetylhexosaminidase|nr:hypothetical protein [Deltaproteobacteria bacterium]